MAYVKRLIAGDLCLQLTNNAGEFILYIRQCAMRSASP